MVNDKSKKNIPTLSDFTSENANHRVLRINLGIVKYGTNDKVQGAAILFCLLLFILITVTISVGVYHKEHYWINKIFSWLTSTFILVLGIAIGRAAVPNGLG